MTKHLLMAGCISLALWSCSSQPKFASNAKFNSVGPEIADMDAQACKRQSEAAITSPSAAMPGSTSITHRREFVDKCLEAKGYDVVGWT